MTHRIFCRRVTALICMVFVSVSLSGAMAQARNDPERGEAVAKVWCANCHLVAEDQTSPVSADAPPFATMARAAGYSDTRIRAFLVEPHGAMKGFDPDERQINDLIAYIRTLTP